MQGIPLMIKFPSYCGYIGPIKRRSDKRKSSRNKKMIMRNTQLTMMDFLFLIAFRNCLVSMIASK